MESAYDVAAEGLARQQAEGLERLDVAFGEPGRRRQLGPGEADLGHRPLGGPSLQCVGQRRPVRHRRRLGRSRPGLRLVVGRLGRLLGRRLQG